MFEWRNIFRGMLIGATDLVPGVSGGTVALLLGIYERLVTAIDGLTTREWKKHLLFLIPLGLGVGISILSLSHLFSWLMETYTKPTFFFFVGLILSIIPQLLVQADFKKNFRASHYVLLIIAAVLVALTGVFTPDQTKVMTDLSWQQYLYLFISGWIASSALILPGISGSLMLLLLGAYATVIDSVKTLNFPILITVGLGIIVGLLLTSKLIRYLFQNYRTLTYAILIGLVVGSIFVVYPGWPADVSLMIASVITLIAGFSIATYLGRL